MDPAALLIFAATLFVAAASPGPGIAAIVARVLGRGLNGAVAFTAGLAVGDVVWLTIAVLGLAAIANTFHVVFQVIKYVGVVYLLYLAYRLWTQAVEAREVVAETSTDKPVRLFLAGLAVTMGNPKVMVFYLALLPSLIDLQAVTLLGMAGAVAGDAQRAGGGVRQLRAAGGAHARSVHEPARHPHGQSRHGRGDGVSGGGHRGQMSVDRDTAHGGAS